MILEYQLMLLPFILAMLLVAFHMFIVKGWSDSILREFIIDLKEMYLLPDHKKVLMKYVGSYCYSGEASEKDELYNYGKYQFFLQLTDSMTSLRINKLSGVIYRVLGGSLNKSPCRISVSSVRDRHSSGTSRVINLEEGEASTRISTGEYFPADQHEMGSYNWGYNSGVEDLEEMFKPWLKDREKDVRSNRVFLLTIVLILISITQLYTQGV